MEKARQRYMGRILHRALNCHKASIDRPRAIRAAHEKKPFCLYYLFMYLVLVAYL